MKMMKMIQKEINQDNSSKKFKKSSGGPGPGDLVILNRSPHAEIGALHYINIQKKIYRTLSLVPKVLI